MEISDLGQSWPIKMDASGRIMVPSEARKLHGWDKDTHLVIEQGDDGTLHILTFEQFIANIQHHFAGKFGDERSMVDELIAERRQEAARDQSHH